MRKLFVGTALLALLALVLVSGEFLPSREQREARIALVRRTVATLERMEAVATEVIAGDRSRVQDLQAGARDVVSAARTLKEGDRPAQAVPASLQERMDELVPVVVRLRNNVRTIGRADDSLQGRISRQEAAEMVLADGAVARRHLHWLAGALEATDHGRIWWNIGFLLLAGLAVLGLAWPRRATRFMPSQRQAP
ncbi:hypothetical protein H8N03_08465 [Ramlibacter sp. USB13]|uniref:Uncharacterized protein n=1 Tax=Ramlibacter cellulosilyticus TaxID=2764187 RepID=A0A923MSF6_9BURK|nr:hypothetical protein [Ramlibacter cellulosilyticus]MBC5782977.1 hypothetical protein [Ramlibacter cellulosilyticus]